MNVTFHVLGSFATTAVLSFPPQANRQNFSGFRRYIIGFIAGVLIHGVLDFLPHQYPLRSKTDVVSALILFAVFSFMAKWQNLLLLWTCFIGSIFPDLVDLSAGIVNKHLAIPIPELPFKIFPWHWKEFSGSIYDGSRNAESAIYHISFLLICLSLLYAYRKSFFKFGTIER
jgi:hypothetical protein